jgi:glutamate-1-semialdehyde 2,1-aminomutase
MTLSALALYGVGGGAGLWALNKAKARAELSLAKHRSLAGHPRTARRIAALLPTYSYDEAQALRVDNAPQDIVTLREQAIARMVS